MAADARALDPEELLARSGWMRSLVRGIVLDDADDIVQDAWVAALERPGAGREPGGLAAWLAAVARNLARRRRRRTALRASVERASAREERVDGPEEQVARMQLQRLVADAVLALDEPQRSAVILRHLDGCSASEIARRQGCSVEAARQRVSRGLAQLRVRLDGELGGRANRVLALAPWLTHSWSGALAAGGAVVGVKTVIGVATVAVAVAAVYVVASEGGSTERRTQATVPVIAGAAPAERSEPASAAVVLAEARTEEAEAASAAQSVFREPVPGTLLARGRVTDTRGNALEKAEVRIAGVTVHSGADGGFELELASSGERSLGCHVELEGYLPGDIAFDPARSLEVRLQRLPALEGLIVHDGRAVAPPGYVNVHVVQPSGEPFDGEAELGADGSYRVAGLAPGRVARLETRARGFATTRIEPDLELRPDETSSLIVELEKGATVTGIVLDAESREPLPGAEVWVETFAPEGDSVHPSTVADEHGRFRLEGAEEDFSDQEDARFVSFWLMARAEGHVPTPVNGYASQVNDERVYDFELLLQRATSALEVRAFLPDGRPARGAFVAVIDAQGNPSFVSTDGDGRHRFEGLPAGRMALWLAEGGRSVTPTGKGTATVEATRHSIRVELEIAAGESRSETLVLAEAGEVLEGRVVDVQGRPAADLVIEATLVFQFGGLAVTAGSEYAVTDAAGRYRFERLAAGRYQVRPSGEVCASPAMAEGVMLGGDSEPREVDFICGDCLTIEGRVETRGELSGLELAACDPLTGEPIGGSRPEASGSFSFPRLLARDYEVRLLRNGEVLDRALARPDPTEKGARRVSGLVLRVP